MSALRCKAGDLAVVSGPARTPGLLGRFVIVEAIYHSGEEFLAGQVAIAKDPSWICRAAVNGGMLPLRDLITGAVFQMPKRVIADRILSPIRPDAEDQATDLISIPGEVTA